MNAPIALHCPGAPRGVRGYHLPAAGPWSVGAPAGDDTRIDRALAADLEAQIAPALPPHGTCRKCGGTGAIFLLGDLPIACTRCKGDGSTEGPAHIESPSRHAKGPRSVAASEQVEKNRRARGARIAQQRAAERGGGRVLH